VKKRKKDDPPLGIPPPVEKNYQRDSEEASHRGWEVESHSEGPSLTESGDRERIAFRQAGVNHAWNS